MVENSANMLIYIKAQVFPKAVTLIVNPSQTIESVKAQILHSKSIPIAQQELTFARDIL
jgi:hypothetical protein